MLWDCAPQRHHVAEKEAAVQSLSRVLLREPVDCSTPGCSALHCLPEFAQIHVH